MSTSNENLSLNQNNELRASILAKLESQGIINKLRSEVRFHVFNELDNQSGNELNDQSTSQSVNLSVQQEGVYLLDLVREYLQFHGLLRSLSMLEAEAVSSISQPSISPSYQSNNQSLSSPIKSRPIDRSMIATKLNMSETLAQVHSTNQSTKPRRSLLHSLQIQSQSSRPPSPLISPRSLRATIHSPLSEDRPISMIAGIDFTPPDSPPESSFRINKQFNKHGSSTPPRIISSPGKSPSKSPPAERAAFIQSYNQSRLNDLSQKLSHLRPDDIQHKRDQMDPDERINSSSNRQSSNQLYNNQPNKQSSHQSFNSSDLPNLQTVSNRDDWAARYEYVESARKHG